MVNSIAVIAGTLADDGEIVEVDELGEREFGVPPLELGEAG